MSNSFAKELLTFVADFVRCFILVAFQLFLSGVKWILPCRYKNIENDIILITGGGRGLGRMVALEFCKYKPKHIILWGRHTETLSATYKEVKELGVECSYMVCDVSDQTQVYKQAEVVLEKIGQVSILVNNAGIVYGRPILESRDEDIERTLKVNTLGHFWTIKAFLPGMISCDHGHIVTMGSILGLVGLAGAGDYSSSKSALAGMSEALMFELEDELKTTNIKVTSVCPYQVANTMFAGVKPRFPSLFPPISEEYVAEKSVHAILLNQKQILLPRMMYLLWGCKCFLPVPALMSSFHFMGVDKAMQTFEGGTSHRDH